LKKMKYPLPRGSISEEGLKKVDLGLERNARKSHCSRRRKKRREGKLRRSFSNELVELKRTEENAS